MVFDLDKEPIKFDYRQEAIRKIKEAIDQNQELFVAQAIKINPDLNPLDYVLCHMDYDGSYKFWLEKKEEVS
jgi:hypothetical protein